jgi:tetratricopeptide (TPR) repeat protein
MGVVYEAEHIDLERRVALKVLRHRLCSNTAVLRQFRDEAKAASRIGSQYIVQIFDFAELGDGRLLFAMEMLEGPSLADEIRTHGTFGPARAVGILRQMCKGLADAHDVGIIHRDIKPDNVILTEHLARPDAVKILDFGIATVLDKQDASSGPAAGTPDYLAPEIIIGLVPDARADIYALGCTAYEMLTGETPFDGSDIADLLMAHVERAPRPITEFRDDVPPGLVDVVMQCLSKTPNDRFVDMRDLEAALCEAQIEGSFQTTWDDLPLPDVDPDRRGALVSGMPDVIGGSAPRKRSLWILGAAVLGLVTVGGFVGYQLRDDPAAASANENTQIERLMNQARAAAARSYYVYPPSDAPETPTAYVNVYALEQIKGDLAPIAADAAGILREEFADTLIRLGDRYWEEPEGKAFAVDYYMQALVFDGEREPARTRAMMTPGQLAMLRHKSEVNEFSEAELIAVEPLAVLAEEDETERKRRLASWKKKRRKKTGVRTADTVASVDKLLGETPAKAKPTPPPSAADPAPAAEAAAPPTQEVVPIPSSLPPEQADLGRSKRDPKKAAELARRGRKALAASKSSEAETLFEKALGFDRHNAMALIGLSDVFFNRGNYAKSVTYAEKAVKAAPRTASHRVKLGDAYFKVLRYRDARKAYAKAVDLGARDAQWRLDKVNKKLGG